MGTTMPTVVVIGAASTTFGPKVLRDIINHPELAGSVIRFVDIDEQRLDVYARLVRRVVEGLGHRVDAAFATDRREVLPGADVVLVNVEREHFATWQEDFSIPVRHGIRQVQGELGGPGGLFHALRQIPLHLEIARDIAALAPGATVMVASNPLNRLCLAMRRHSGVGPILGLCHGVEIVQNLFGRKLFDLPAEQVVATAAGTNHLTWILDLRHSETGEDLYPRLREKLETAEPTWEPLSRKLFEVFGYYPSCGDAHIGEYIPYAYEFVGLAGRDFAASLQEEQRKWRQLEALAAGTTPLRAGLAGQREEAEELLLQSLFAPRSWVDTLAWPILSARVTNRLRRMPAVNMLNEGTIANLPADVFVEAPAMVDGSGVWPVRIGALPEGPAAFCRRDTEQAELTVEAAVRGQRRLVLQAMLLDPVVDSVRAAERVLEEMLRVHARHLPSFA